MPNTTSTTLYAVDRFAWEKIIRATPMRPVTLKALALVLATYADADTGSNIYPGLARLADNLDQDERTIRRNLEVLERCGVIHKRFNGSSIGRRGGMASEYQLCLPGDVIDQYSASEGDEVYPFFRLIQDGHREGYSTWTERNPRKPPRTKVEAKARPVNLTGTPDIHDRTVDIHDRTPDIHDRTVDIHDRTVDTHVHPPNIPSNIPSNIPPTQEHHRSASLRSAGANAPTPTLEDPLDKVTFTALPQDLEAEMNRQTTALSSKYPEAFQ